MTGYRQNIGRIGEAIAVEYCRGIGYHIIEKHYTSRWGEVDIIAKDGKEIVFIEVKCRCSDVFGAPEESVTSKKVSRLVKTAEIYLSSHVEIKEYRIDVIAVNFLKNRIVPTVRHIKGIDILDQQLSEVDEFSI